MLNRTKIFINVLNEIFFEDFVRSNMGIKEYCSTKNLPLEETKDILFRRATPDIKRLSELVNMIRNN